MPAGAAGPAFGGGSAVRRSGHAARPAPWRCGTWPPGAWCAAIAPTSCSCARAALLLGAAGGIPIHRPGGGDGKARLVCGKAGGIRQKITKEWGLNPCAAFVGLPRPGQDPAAAKRMVQGMADLIPSPRPGRRGLLRRRPTPRWAIGGCRSLIWRAAASRCSMRTARWSSCSTAKFTTTRPCTPIDGPGPYVCDGFRHPRCCSTGMRAGAAPCPAACAGCSRLRCGTAPAARCSVRGTCSASSRSAIIKRARRCSLPAKSRHFWLTRPLKSA